MTADFRATIGSEGVYEARSRFIMANGEQSRGAAMDITIEYCVT
jgi:hypothetical protein